MKLPASPSIAFATAGTGKRWVEVPIGVIVTAVVYKAFHERPAGCYYDNLASGYIWLWV
jgi:hypothetical protein